MEYVCTGATLKCTMGTATSTLKATPKNVTLVGKDQANIADHISMVNIPSFGRCRSLAYPPTASATAANHGKLTPMPCVPGTCTKWQAIDGNSLICGEPALLKVATVGCMYGGTISIVNPGQFLEVKKSSGFGIMTGAAAPIEMENEDELSEEEIAGLDSESLLDGIQLALDAAGFAPGVGAIPDVLNAGIYFLRGNRAEAALSLLAAVPVVGDAAAAGKIIYKGAKIAQKTQKAQKIGKSAKSVSPVKERGSHNAIDELAKKRIEKTSNGNKNDIYQSHRERFAEAGKSSTKKYEETKIYEIRTSERKVSGGGNVKETKITTKTISNSIDGNVNSPSGVNPFENTNRVQPVSASPQSNSSTYKQEAPNWKQQNKNEEPIDFQSYKTKKETGVDTETDIQKQIEKEQENVDMTKKQMEKVDNPQVGKKFNVEM